MSVRKIATWHDAGLIDAATRDRLLAYEAAHARPLALWAVFGLGALTIALGLVSVIAANWEAIPGQVRLAVHFALIIAALAALFTREVQIAAASPWAVEALLFVTGALGLTFFGHLGQVYQTASPIWQPLALWLVVFAPLLLLMGRGWLAATMLMGVSIWCVWEYATAATAYGTAAPVSTAMTLWLAVVTSAPVLFAPLAAWQRERDQRGGFWRRLEQLAFAYALAGATLACALASVGGLDDVGGLLGLGPQAVRGAIAVAAGLGVIAARRSVSGRMAGTIIAGAGAAMLLACVANALMLPAAAVFMGLWAGVAAAALSAQWRGVFQLAVAVLAVRLIILSFELAGDLLISGFGLIGSGLLILGIAWGALRVSRRYAPPAGAGAGGGA